MNKLEGKRKRKRVNSTRHELKDGLLLKLWLSTTNLLVACWFSTNCAEPPTDAQRHRGLGWFLVVVNVGLTNCAEDEYF